jgi:hypothetical protein
MGAGARTKATLGAVMVCFTWTGLVLAQAAPPPAPAPAPAPAPPAAQYRPVQPVAQPAAQPAAAQPAAAQPAAPAPTEARLGGNGESCRARADCQGGLMCVSGICRWEGLGSVCEATADCKQPLVCVAQSCSDPNAPAPAPGYGQPGAYGQPAYQAAPGYGYPAGQAQAGPYVAPEKGPFDGTRFLAGVGFSGGPGWVWAGFGPNSQGMGMFDLKVGGLFQRREISIAYAPVFDFPGTEHSIRLETANYHQLGSTMYWPVRVSIGGVFGYGRGAMMTGFDFLNFGFAVSDTLIEINLAKLRLISNFDDFRLGLLFGFTAHYGTPP